MLTKEKIQTLIKSLSGTQKAFAERLGKPQSTIANWVNRGELPLAAIELIYEKYPELSSRWLITGKGSMFEEEVMLKKEQKEEITSFWVKHSKEFLETGTNLLYPDNGEQLSKISMPKGLGIDAYLLIDNCTMEPTVCKGDIIGVKKADMFTPIKDNDLFLITTKSKLNLIRRIERIPGDESMIRLISDNPEEKTIKAEKKEIERLFKIVYIGRYL